MAGGMTSIYIGVSGVQSAQIALNTTTHNLSNVYTPGYTRQLSFTSDRNYNNIGYGALEKKQVGLGPEQALDPAVMHHLDVLKLPVNIHILGNHQFQLVLFYHTVQSLKQLVGIAVLAGHALGVDLTVENNLSHIKSHFIRNFQMRLKALTLRFRSEGSLSPIFSR